MEIPDISIPEIYVPDVPEIYSPHYLTITQPPEIVEKGTFGKDGWSISIGNVEDGNTKD